MNPVFFTSIKQALLRAAEDARQDDPQEYGHLMLLTEQLQKLIDQPAPTLVVIVDGGVMQSVVCDQDIDARVYKVEYTDDQEGEDDENVYEMPQLHPDGKKWDNETAKAWVGRFPIEFSPKVVSGWMPQLEASDEV